MHAWFHLAKAYDWRRPGAEDHAKHRAVQRLKRKRHEKKLWAQHLAQEQHARKMIKKELDAFKDGQKAAFNDQGPPGDWLCAMEG